MAYPKEITEAISYIIANKKTAFFATFLFQNRGTGGQKMRVVYDAGTKTAATDGMTIWVGDWFLSLKILERVFVLCHEILHAILDHMLRATQYKQRGFGMDLLPFNMKRANWAQDYVINAALLSSRIGTMPTQGLFRNVNDASRTWDDVYHEIEVPDGDEGEGGGDGDGHGGFDEHKPANAEAHDPRAHKQALTQARNAAKAVGEMPAGLKRLIDGILEPQVPWKEVLSDFMQIHAGKDETSYRRLNRRRLAIPPPMCWPGKDGFRMNSVVISIDCSGSIGDAELKAFLGEVKSILTSVAPREVHVLWWDTDAVHVEVESDDVDSMDSMEAYGGGGTDYTCVPKKIGELDLEPDAVVCLTDGYVRWPDAGEIRWPHLTVSTGKGAPFGKSTVIHV